MEIAKDFNQAFLGVFTVTYLRKVMREKLTEKERRYLEKALNFFKRAKEGYEILTAKNHRTILKTCFRPDKAMNDLEIVLKILMQCRQGHCFVQDKDFEVGRKTLFKFANEENGVNAFLDKCIGTLETITKGQPAKPADIALPAFFFKVLYKEAHARISVSKSCCF